MISINKKSTYALSPQKKVGIFDYPFTLNPFIGCEMQCKYCFVPGPVIKTTRKDFFENVQIKVNIVDLLKKELNKYSNLPQHLKRVQFGVTTEIFQPKVISHMKKDLGRDLIAEILEVFQTEWNNDNKWMLHILTKNHNIVSYIDQLKNMNEMVQVEFSFIHSDETISRKYEAYTSSIVKRLNAITQLSNENIFVRVMAMPFYGNDKELKTLKNNAFKAGANAFKNKSLNYYDWSQLENVLAVDDLSRVKSKTNQHINELIINSGEAVQPASSVNLLMPKSRKRGDKFINWAIHPVTGLESISVEKVEMGYSMINNIDWKYLN